MTTISVLSDDAMQALKRDHERLRYELRAMQVILQSCRAELADDSPHWIEFHLTAALATSDASQGAHVVSGYGPGLPAAETAVTVLNLLTATASVYVFSGANGAKGLAVHKGGTNYQIFQMQCP